jgi:DNA-binding transcriptional LysR family regulator
MIELRLIRNALALARTRNFARAARALDLTQPSLSRSIASLEAQLGARLFDRTRDGVVPTAYGRLLLERGAALVDDEARLRSDLAALGGLVSGTLTVGAEPCPAEVSVGEAVARMLRTHPEVAIDVVTADAAELAERLLEGRLELVVAAGPPASTRIVHEPLARHEVRFGCRPGHPLAGRAAPTVAQVLQFPLVGHRLCGPAVEVLAPHARAGRRDPVAADFVPFVHASSLALARRIARGSDALLPAPAPALAEDVAHGRLVLLQFRLPGLWSDYGISMPAGRTPSPAAAAFGAMLRVVEAGIANGAAAEAGTAEGAPGG